MLGAGGGVLVGFAVVLGVVATGVDLRVVATEVDFGVVATGVDLGVVADGVDLGVLVGPFVLVTVLVTTAADVLGACEEAGTDEERAERAATDTGGTTGDREARTPVKVGVGDALTAAAVVEALLDGFLALWTTR